MSFIFYHTILTLHSEIANTVDLFYLHGNSVGKPSVSLLDSSQASRLGSLHKYTNLYIIVSNLTATADCTVRPLTAASCLESDISYLWVYSYCLCIILWIICGQTNKGLCPKMKWGIKPNAYQSCQHTSLN